MADINAGNHLRFDNGGTITIDGDNLLNIVSGSVRFRAPGYEPILTFDRGVMQEILEGDERPCEIEIDVRVASGTAADVLGALAGAGTNGVKKKADIVFTVFDNRDASTGDSWTFDDCYLPDGWEYQTVAGQDTDRIQLRLQALDLDPAYAAVS